MANTVASALPFGDNHGHGQGGFNPIGQLNPLNQAPNLTVPLSTMPNSGKKLSRKEKKAQKRALQTGAINPEFNNAAIY